MSHPAAQALKDPLTILVVYEDVLTGLLARSMLDYITGVLRPGHEVRVTLQRAEGLPVALPADAQASNSPGAPRPDVLLVSLYGRKPLPALFERCMESRVGDQTARHGGLAAVLVNSTAANGCRAALEQVARERGWDFFSWQP